MSRQGRTWYVLLAFMLGGCAPRQPADAPSFEAAATPKEEAEEEVPSADMGEPEERMAFAAEGRQEANITHRVVRSVDEVSSDPPTPGSYRVHLIDVGTGLSVLVQGADFNFLFDGGSGDDTSGITKTKNNSRLLAYLWEAIGESGPKGCRPGSVSSDVARPELTIGTVVLGHPHEDHGVFLDEVLQCYHVNSVYDSGRINDTVFYGNFVKAVAAESGVTYRTAIAPRPNKEVTVDGTTSTIPKWENFAEGEVVTLGQGASFKILHADGEDHPDPNENSIVLRVDLGDTSLLLTSDAESGPRLDPSGPLGDIEEHLVTTYPEDIDVDILQVGHHGSMTSSRTAFLEAVSPQWALIGDGPKKYQTVVLPDEVVVDKIIEIVGDADRVLQTNTSDSGCPAADRIGNDDAKPGGCDNHILEISAKACCKICATSKPCGDTCIPMTSTCSKPSGCACND